MPRLMPPSITTAPRPSTAATDLGQDVERRRHAVELAPTVIGDDDARRAVLDREARVLGGQHPLDQHRQPRSEDASCSRSRQVSAGSSRPKTSAMSSRLPVPIAAATLGTLTSAGTWNPVRRSRSRRPP